VDEDEEEDEVASRRGGGATAPFILSFNSLQITFLTEEDKAGAKQFEVSSPTNLESPKSGVEDDVGCEPDDDDDDDDCDDSDADDGEDESKPAIARPKRVRVLGVNVQTLATVAARSSRRLASRDSKPPPPPPPVLLLLLLVDRR
jgi:hypothetical protein